MDCPYCNERMQKRLCLMGVSPDYWRDWGHFCVNAECEAAYVPALPGRTLAQFHEAVDQFRPIKAKFDARRPSRGVSK